MLTPQFCTYVRDGRLSSTSPALLGQTVVIPLEQLDAIEEIVVNVRVRTAATAATLTLDGLLAAVKRVSLQVPDLATGQMKTRVDYSGIGLLELAVNTGMNVDRSTASTIQTQLSGLVCATASYFSVSYRIPCCPPSVQEGLRSRFLLPCVAMSSAPQLTIEFGTAADMASANAPDEVLAEVMLIKRRMPPSTFEYYNKLPGGFLTWDLIETPFIFAATVSGEVQLELPQRGYALGYQYRMYLGAATVIRQDISAAVGPTNYGKETRWRIESGSQTLKEWRMRQLQLRNDWSRPLNSCAALAMWGGYHPTTNLGVSSGTVWVTAKQVWAPTSFGGALAAGLSIQDPSSVYDDFLTDGAGNDANELGSVLDLETPAVSGQKVYLRGELASPTTNGHKLYVGGYRILSDISPWRTMPKAA
jgi:hypothetical protein